MIRVIVELIPNGDEHNKHELGRLEIVNTGDHPDAPLYGAYTAQFATRRVSGDVAAHQRYLSRFERTRYNVWGLILMALDSLTKDSSGIANTEPFEI